MKCIQAYETTDGKLFTNEADAKAHQADINFGIWYNEHKLYGDYTGSKVSINELKEWLHEHKQVVANLLGL